MGARAPGALGDDSRNPASLRRSRRGPPAGLAAHDAVAVGPLSAGDPGVGDPLPGLRGGPSGPRPLGHPHTDYTADLFIDKIAGFLDQIGIEPSVLVGESIGATTALGLAARHLPRVRAVVAIRDIECPVLLLYGDHDWSRPDERAETARLIHNARIWTVKDAGHFLSFDAPVEMVEQVVEFVEEVP